MQPAPKPQPPTPQQWAQAQATAKKLIEKARAYIVLDHAFFASIMLKHPLIETDRIPTLAVSPSGTIYYNPMFVSRLNVNQVVHAYCHEILHYASGHSQRKGSRNHKKWNYATDMWINDTLVEAKVGETIPGAIYVPGSHARTCEDIYASLPDDDGGDEGGGGGGGGGGDDPFDGDIEYDEDGQNAKSESELEAQRKLDVAEAAQVAKIKGKLPGVLAKFAADTVESKVPWFDILERYMTSRIKNDSSWARPNRRYMPDYYLPTLDSVGAMGPIVIQVDISGSVSRQEIAHYNGHMKRIVEQCRPSKVHVIYTDTRVQKHEEYDSPEDVEIKYHSGGGTHMPAGFKYVEDMGIEPEVMVTLTDGYTDWDAEPPFPTIQCISSDQDAPYGEIVRFKLEA